MIITGEMKKKNIVFLPEIMLDKNYKGELYGKFNKTTGVFNVFSNNTPQELFDQIDYLGKIIDHTMTDDDDFLLGKWQEDGTLKFSYKGIEFSYQLYSILNNIFSRNTGILESSIMKQKTAMIIGCGSVGSLVALELARAGVGNFVLIDNDIIEYHNICRHQCSVMDVGELKVDAVSKRILEINPSAMVIKQPKIIEEVPLNIFADHCKENEAIIIGCGDNRISGSYANKMAAMFSVPFINIGFWERAFAGEIFYFLPNSNMPCYQSGLGMGNAEENILNQAVNTNHRLYTNQEDLAKVNFEPGISIDINFVTTVGIKLILDILNIENDQFTPRLINYLTQYTILCNTNKKEIGGEMADFFAHPLEIINCIHLLFGEACKDCNLCQITIEE